MPSVNANPDAFLINKINDLESRIRTLETRRTGNFAAFQVLSSIQSVTGSVFNTIGLTSTNIDTGGIVDLAGDKVTLPWEGYYNIHLTLPPASPSVSTSTLIYSVTRAADIAGINTTLVASEVYSDYIYIQANEELQLRVNPGSNTSVGGFRWTMTFHRPKIA